MKLNSTKPLFGTALAIALSVTLAGCGGGAGNTSQTTEPTSDATETEEQSSAIETEEATEVMTYDEFVDAEVDDPVTIEAYVQAKQEWWEDQATLYLQDEDGGYLAYNAACTEADYDKLVEGQKVRVSGFKAEWSGEVEIAEGEIEILDGTWIAKAVDVTDELGTTDLIDHMNQKVAFTGLTVAPSIDADGQEVAFLYNYDGSGSAGQNDDLYFNVSDGTDTYSFTVESYLSDESSDVYQTVTELKVGDTIDAEGFLYWYEGANPHITSVTVK